jgi:predicted deacetylase
LKTPPLQPFPRAGRELSPRIGPAASVPQAAKFCVIVHDVTPVFAREVNTIFEHLLPEVGNTLAGALVPCWHGVELDTRGRRIMRGWSSLCGETLLHGWTHRREYRPGIVSWVTGRADEFGGCSQREVIERVRRGRESLQKSIGRAASGLVPPAWQMPLDLDDLRDSGIAYILNFKRLQSVSGHNVALATYSWDWGRFTVLSRVGASLGTCLTLWNRHAVPVIVLHPADVRRGHIVCAVNLIRRLKSAGAVPVGIGDLMAGPNSELVSTPAPSRGR